MATSDATQKLASHLELLSKNIQELSDLFSKATKRFEATPGDAILDKLDTIHSQNEKIASAVLSLIELIKVRLLEPHHTQSVGLPRAEKQPEEEGIPALLPSFSQSGSLNPATYTPYEVSPGSLPPPPLPPGKKRMPMQSFEASSSSFESLQPIQQINAPQPIARMSLEERRRKLGL